MPLSGKNNKNHYSQSEYETWLRHYENENEDFLINKNTKNPCQGHKSYRLSQSFKLYVLYEQAPKPIYLAVLHLPNVRLCPCQAKTIKTITRGASTKRGYATTKTFRATLA